MVFTLSKPESVILLMSFLAEHSFLSWTFQALCLGYGVEIPGGLSLELPCRYTKCLPGYHVLLNMLLCP